jgi:biotin carboxyl carrier protein
MKNLRVTVDGKTFNVSVEILDEPSVAAAPKRPAAPAPVSAPVAAPVAAGPAPVAVAAPVAGGPGEVLSPLAGKIVSIDVAVGQDVEEGAQVATIEAMKMNTYVFAPRSGKVTAVIASAGTAIEEGRPLLVIS